MKFEKSLSVMQKTIALIETELFRDVASEELASIAVSAIEVQLEAGEVLGPSVRTWNHLHVVVDGEIEISHGEMIIHRITKGKEFGILPMLGIDDELRFTAIKPSTTIALSEPDFRRALFNSPDLALGIVRTLAMGIHQAVLRIKELEKEKH